MSIEDVLRETDRRLALRRRGAMEATESALHGSSHGVMAVLLEMPDFRSVNIVAGVSMGTGEALAKDGSIDLAPLDFEVTEGYLYKLALMLVAPKCVLNIYFDRDLAPASDATDQAMIVSIGLELGLFQIGAGENALAWLNEIAALADSILNSAPQIRNAVLNTALRLDATTGRELSADVVREIVAQFPKVELPRAVADLCKRSRVIRHQQPLQDE